MIDVETIFDSDREEYEFMKENKERPMKDQIEEMARIIGAAIEFDELDFGMGEKTEIIAEKAAKKFYNAGYRKQSEVDIAKNATTTGVWHKRFFEFLGMEKEGYKCSECNTTWDTETKFCPNCGAHMTGGKNE